MLLNYHIGRFFLVLLCVGDLVRLGLGSVRIAGLSGGQFLSSICIHSDCLSLANLILMRLLHSAGIFSLFHVL